MVPLPTVLPEAVVQIVNEFGTEPRVVAGEQSVPKPDPARMAGVDVPGGTTRDEVSRVADALWPVFAASPGRRAGIFNAILTSLGLRPIVDEGGQIRWQAPEGDAVQFLTAACAAAVLDVVGHAGWDALGTCDASDCVDVYIEVSGRHRRYCSPTCLNRARIRAYRARQRDRGHSDGTP